METPVPEEAGSDPLHSNDPVNVESSGVAAANAADAAAAEAVAVAVTADPVKPDEPAVQAAATSIAALSGTSMVGGGNLWYRVDIWKTVFTAHLVHGVDAAINAAETAVKAFESLFGK